MKQKSYKTKTTLLLGSMLCAFVSLFASCNVFEYPEPCDDPLPAPNKVKVHLKLVYSPDFYIWNHTYDSKSGKIVESDPSLDIFPDYPGTSSKYTNLLPEGVMDVSVKVYQTNSSNLYADETFSQTLDGETYDRLIEMELDELSSYQVAVWSHLKEDSKTEAFYDASDFNRVGLISDNYQANTDYRDGYSSKIGIETVRSEEEEIFEVEMTRPMGKFEIVATDLQAFLQKETQRRGLASPAKAEEYHVVISFPYYYPSSYSVIDDRLENAVAGVSFRSKMESLNDNEASLGFEYVMLNDIADSGVQMRVEIYDPSFTQVASTSTMTIPMRRDHHTVIKGEFLSTEGNGGIGIDPGFNGDHNITV